MTSISSNKWHFIICVCCGDRITLLAFLNRYADKAGTENEATPNTLASRKAAAKAVAWHISTVDGWARKYYDPNDLYFHNRALFA